MTSTWTEPENTPLALLLLGQGSDPAAEPGVECPGELPAPSDPGLVARATAARAALGDRAFILGHHYQRDEIIQFADVTGDSFKLAREAAARPDAEYIVFCGVHFMAESADILTSDSQRVVLPDLAAGCSMADMATLAQVETAWDLLAELGLAGASNTGNASNADTSNTGNAGDTAGGDATGGDAASGDTPDGGGTVPVTYMNSSADIKGFVGRNGGVVCTSSNAKRALDWAFSRGRRVLFLPDQHLGRNTAVLEMGLSLDDCVLYDPHLPGGGLTHQQLRDARMILWKGHCSVHGRFTLESVREVRDRLRGVNVLVHPECRHEVVLAADLVGSTEFIIKTLDAAPAGSSWAIGTELNLVRRLANAHPDKRVVFLDKTVCYCSTMNRIDLPHLVWAMEELVAGRVVNRITVDPGTAHHARVALDRMLALP